MTGIPFGPGASSCYRLTKALTGGGCCLVAVGDAQSRAVGSYSLAIQPHALYEHVVCAGARVNADCDTCVRRYRAVDPLPIRNILCDSMFQHHHVISVVLQQLSHFSSDLEHVRILGAVGVVDLRRAGHGIKSVDTHGVVARVERYHDMRTGRL